MEWENQMKQQVELMSGINAGNGSFLVGNSNNNDRFIGGGSSNGFIGGSSSHGFIGGGSSSNGFIGGSNGNAFINGGSSGNAFINGGSSGNAFINGGSNNEFIGGSNGVFIKVMTDNQLETLRKQISAYAIICEQLIEMHKFLTSQPELSGGGGGGGGGGARLGGLYSNPLVATPGHKIFTGRQRWAPTPTQLQILEGIFDQGIGTPIKQKIIEITKELSQHGQVTEANVYNWFQNRRARSKRKQHIAGSEVETEIESPKDKKARSEDIQPQNMFIPNTAISSGVQQQQQLHSEDLQTQNIIAPCNAFQELIPTDESDSKSNPSLSQMMILESMLSDSPGIDHLIGDNHPFFQEDDEYDVYMEN